MRLIIRRPACTALAVWALFAITACGGQNESTDSGTEPAISGGNTLQVSDNVLLERLSISIGDEALELEPAAGIYAHTVTAEVTSIAVTPVATSTFASVKVNDVLVAPGESSSAIGLSIGTNFINVLVTAQDGVTVERYSIVVTRFDEAPAFELRDPTPRASKQFGSQTTILSNGNIVVSDPTDASVASNNGAVHLYDASTATLISSFYGDQEDDFLGSTIVVLQNQNYIIFSRRDNVGRIKAPGTVRLINGLTGEQIGDTIVGEQPGARLGNISELRNGNYVIASPNDNAGGIRESGSVRLVNGTTGEEIGTPIVGDNIRDWVGRVFVMANGNYVIAAEHDDINDVEDAGSIRLVDGTTGAQIGDPIVGVRAEDMLGSVRELSNGNFVASSNFGYPHSFANTGLIRLIDGVTGVQIGDDIEGSGGIGAVGNNNFTIRSEHDTVAGIKEAGSVRLFNGSTGEQIGVTIAGDQESDQMGNEGIVWSLDGNYLIVSSRDDVNGVVGAGSVRLVDSATGEQINDTIAGEELGDLLGSRGEIALSKSVANGASRLGNGNFLIVSKNDDVDGVANAGSVRLVHGTTGVQISSAIVGVRPGTSNYLFGGIYPSVTILNNSNYVIATPHDDVGGVVDAGSVRLFDGTTGMQMGSAIVGDQANDRTGTRITPLSNGNYVISSPEDDVGGVVDAGSVRLVDGTTGASIGSAIEGNQPGEQMGTVRWSNPLGGEDSVEKGITALSNGNYVVASSLDDVDGVAQAGSVQLIDGTTGEQISIITGDQPRDFYTHSTEEEHDFHYHLTVTALENNNYVIISSEDDVSGVEDAGSAWLVDGNTGATLNSVFGIASGDLESSEIYASENGSTVVLAAPMWNNYGGTDSGQVRVMSEQQ